MESKLFPSKNRKTTISNSQSLRMLQTHVKNDIYNKYCLIHNNNFFEKKNVLLRARRNEKEFKVKPAISFKYFQYFLTEN